ncbi:MAG: hypothetical protein ACI8Z0_002750 [Lentimonas sp.]|jgi:hypothetical protein
MATTGTLVSTIGHIGLVIWLISGWGFSVDPLSFEVSEMSVVSGEEFARIVAATTPQPGTADPLAPPVPELNDIAPATQSVSEDAPTPTQPDVVEPPVDEVPISRPETPAEPVDVSDAIPELPPMPETPTLGAPDLAVSPRPQERRADRIAPTQVAPPDVDVPVSEIETASAAPAQDTPAEVVEEAVEEAAPEETATAIVPEDAVPSGAVETSVRPSARPNRPEPAPVTPAETSTASSDSVDDAVAAAIADAAAPDVPQGPPMNASEEEGFRVSVQNCWNVGALSTAAQRVQVTVSFQLGRDRKVVENEIVLVGGSGGNSVAIDDAYKVARRAILICQSRSGGFQLPDAKFDRWEEVELTFDPTSMRLR